MVLPCNVKPVLMLPVTRDQPRDAVTKYSFRKVSRMASALKATGKSQSKKPFLLLGGQGIGVNNGGSGPKAQYLAAGGQYECSARRANSIIKWIFTHG